MCLPHVFGEITSEPAISRCVRPSASSWSTSRSREVSDAARPVPAASPRRLRPQFASHMDVNAVVSAGEDAGARRALQQEAAENIKRVIERPDVDWSSDAGANPYLIRDTQETKTTWHPVGS